MRPQKPCRQPHGTIARYTAGCSCFFCRVAWTRYQVARSRTPMKVAIAPVLRHVANLHAQGMEYQDIAFAAGITVSTLSWIRAHGRAVRRDTADAILGVVGPRARRPVDAERARIMLTEGHSVRRVAEELQCSERHIYRLEASA